VKRRHPRAPKAGGFDVGYEAIREETLIDFALADPRQAVVRRMKRAGLLETIGEDRIYVTVEKAIQSLAPAVPGRG
jgi:hypothetical protein